jgi:DNA polymerase-1
VPAAIGQLREVLSNGLVEKSVHDMKRAVGLLDRFNITLEGVKDDTFLAAYLLDPTRSKYELTISRAKRSTSKRKQARRQTGRRVQWQTARRRPDRANCARLCATAFSKRNSKRSIRDGTAARAFALSHGARFESRSQSAVRSVELLGQELHKLTIKIYELAGREFNIGSPKQVGEVLSDLNIDIGRKTSTGRISTSKAVLEELAQQFELPRLIIDYRELDKLKSVYTDALPHQIATDGRIHCLLNQTVAATGRLSSSDPNLQNIPIRSEMGRRIRRAFVAEKGNKIISADYSQLELRLLAHITQDPVMLEAFQKAKTFTRARRGSCSARRPTKN